ncbi:SIMPL domain-containing protein [Cytobacillus sp. FJAT-54145]|uniref:SIMPL domain-containing protein n=1 Tax=Cytobacillus spartinae TaxID=3299023 RepID=A0ABW6KE96_9BACI
MYYTQPNYRYMSNVQNHYRHEVSTIKVIGEGVVSIQPDQVKVTVGVITEDKELKKAQQENARRTTNVIQSLTSLGIPSDQIRTVNFAAYPVYDFVEGEQIFKGYKVEHKLRVTINQIKNVGTVVDTAVNNGVNFVSQIEFSVSNQDKSYRQALSISIINAIEKAKTIAQTLQVQLINTPLKITEHTTQQKGPVPFTESQVVMAADTTPIEAGTLEIKAEVTALFSFYT